MGYSHTCTGILTIRVCTAVQDMVFKPFFHQEQGIENLHFRLEAGCQI